MIRLVEFATFYKIENYRENMRASLKIMDMLTSYDLKGDKIPLGYLNDGNNLRIGKGFDLKIIQECFGRIEHVKKKELYMEYRKDHIKHLNITLNPFDYQADIIKKVLSEFKDNTQFTINLPTGKGKTMTALMIAKALDVPVLIIIKDKNLKKQWFDKLHKDCKIRYDDICEITGFSSVSYLESIQVPASVYVMTHASIRSIVGSLGYQKFNLLLHRMGIGLKVIDEFDMEFRNIIELDLNTSIRYNLYLTATTYKSSKSEDVVYQNTFKNVPRAGKEFFVDEIGARIVDIVSFKSSPNTKERYLCYDFKGNFTPFRYNDYLFNTKRETLIKVLKPFIEEFLTKYDAEDLMSIHVEKKESCKIMQDILVYDFKINISDTGILNSDTDDRIRPAVMKKKFIISTAKSCGRGLDIPNLVYLINLETFASTSTFEQQIGRIGRVGGKPGKYVMFIDRSYLPIIMFNKGKIKMLEDSNIASEVNNKYHNIQFDRYVSDVDGIDIKSDDD